ncbi:preprotein translocase subunit YajC [Parafrankia discariae]|uniref:preprotein translocase subunit YajC n=1 Tax=Parafrankia discariae TaxID=365528 RepID=UPI00036655FB|nr:preprotein translocase subunit YajC [Parafrankia discariae]
MQVFAAVTNAADNSGGSSISGLIFPILIVLLIVYFFSTQRRRARAQQQQLSEIVPGTLVLTTAGLYATVVEMDGADVLLEIAPDVVCRFGRSAIARVISAPGQDGDADADDEDTDGHPDADGQSAVHGRANTDGHPDTDPPRPGPGGKSLGGDSGPGAGEAGTGADGTAGNDAGRGAESAGDAARPPRKEL